MLTSNRFDLLRLVFASMVVIFHAVALSAYAPSSLLEQVTGGLAGIAVEGFFVVSGALVFGSFERSRSLGLYSEKRVRRIYPAYALVVIVPALASLVVAGPGALSDILKYLAANLVFLNFLHPDLPSLFVANRFSEVNGALWTIKIEVMFYIAVPVIALLLRAIGGLKWGLIAFIYVAAEAWRLLIPQLVDHALAPELARQLPGQMSYFVSGIALWLIWETAQSRALLFGLVGGALFIASLMHPLAEPLRAAGLAGLVAFVAFAPGPKLNAARFGDVSYGVYITHFPIIQALLMLGLLPMLGATLTFVAAFALILLASAFLWWTVEKPALRGDSHYRKADITDG